MLSHDLHRYRLPRVAFDQICSGAVSEETMALLISGQYSKRRLLLLALLALAETNRITHGVLTNVEYAWQLLADVERKRPDIVRDVLLYPTVGVWARRALRGAKGLLTANTSNWSELGYLHSIAAAAAIRCGQPCRIQVPVTYGVVALPTLGHVRLPTSFPVGAAEVHNNADGAYLSVLGQRVSVNLRGAPRSSFFSPTKRHRVSARKADLHVLIDDADPYREFSDPSPPNELDQFGFTQWCKLLDEAWEILTLWHPDYARELAAGLAVLVPMEPSSGRLGASSSAAFGGIALLGNGSVTEFAEALIHELQHSKLNALLDLVKLVRDGTKRHFYAPWREDPRPLTGILHGIYAFVSGIEFWRVQRDLVRERESRTAEFLFAYRRHQVRLAVNSLGSVHELTELGHELVRAVSRRLEGLEEEPVTPELSATVAMMIADHHATWRMRHVRPDHSTVDALATAWLNNGPANGRLVREGTVLADAQRRGQNTRSDLLRTKMLDPDRFAHLVRRPGALPGNTPRADAAYCVGDYEGSRSQYLDSIQASPENGGSWAGLGLCLRAQAEHVAARALLELPEIVVAVHRRVQGRSGVPPGPVSLAAWIGAAMNPPPDATTTA